MLILPNVARSAAGVLAAAALALPFGVPAAAHADPTAVPVVSPTPRSITRTTADIDVPATVGVVFDAGVDEPTRDLVTRALESAGAAVVEGSGPLTVRVGALEAADITEVLTARGVSAPAPMPAEGYVLSVGSPVVLAAADGDGLFYAAQTLRQLVTDGTVAGVQVVDYPAMPLRGSIEGFYGSPWTHAERMDQLAFYGAVKMNTYVYAPKDDPYHREQWREPYPADKLAELVELVQQAADNHVEFTFALSPGTSMCYSRTTLAPGGTTLLQSDVETLIAKLEAMYDIGVRSFSIPLDDISTSRWSCPEDYLTYGLPNSGTAATAHVDLLETIKADFIDTHPDVAPLQTVPTDYAGLADSTYKRTWRDTLDPEIVVMWTGTDVVPTQITNAEAQTASERYGRNVFLWDNYPVNDYDQTRGRLLLAPYDKREPGLSAHLSGIVSNPMNQAAASKVALHTIADFTWNDAAYDRDRAWAAAARHLAGGDAVTTDALLTFFDLNHLAPTFGTSAWLPQAPGLAADLDRFRTLWAAGDHDAAAGLLGGAADRIAAAGSTIRGGVDDALFLSDAAAWLDASDLWGQAFVAYVDALQAGLAGDSATAHARLTDGQALVAQAREVRAPAGENRWSDTRVRFGDGVLDTFLTELEPLVHSQP